MEEDKIQYTTQTGETRVDVPNKRFARINSLTKKETGIYSPFFIILIFS